ncbi:cell division protein FtsX [bacterium BMS3Abin15]|nr:cell division protein FtsX [bacterium BMS3Abin15]
MKLLKLWRTFKEGLRNFYRNGLLTIATVSVLAMSLYVVGFISTRGVMTNLLLQETEKKINISVYFNPEVSENKILEVKDTLDGYQEIKSIEYVSRNRALEEFLAGNQDSVIRQALDEIGGNPLLASLVITANDTGQYDIINEAIEKAEFRDQISRINYQKNKEIIGKLGDTLRAERKEGFVAGIIFIVIAILITFNAIRLTMYSHKQEFEIMRLVGASNMYVRMPFVFEGIFYGIAAAAVSMILLLITAKYSSLSVLFITGDVWGFYVKYWWAILGILLLFGILLGIVGGFVAIRRHLKA